MILFLMAVLAVHNTSLLQNSVYVFPNWVILFSSLKIKWMAFFCVDCHFDIFHFQSLHHTWGLYCQSQHFIVLMFDKHFPIWYKVMAKPTAETVFSWRIKHIFSPLSGNIFFYDLLMIVGRQEEVAELTHS